MRRAGCLLVIGLVLVTGCGGDKNPDNRAGADGAFGGAEDCEQLVAQAVEAYERVLVELGDARRTDTERIDVALESFGGDGPDLAVRYDGLGCGADYDDAVCAAARTLDPQGPAARDLVDTLMQGC